MIPYRQHGKKCVVASSAGGLDPPRVILLSTAENVMYSLLVFFSFVYGKVNSATPRRVIVVGAHAQYKKSCGPNFHGRYIMGLGTNKINNIPPILKALQWSIFLSPTFAYID